MHAIFELITINGMTLRSLTAFLVLVTLQGPAEAATGPGSDWQLNATPCEKVAAGRMASADYQGGVTATVVKKSRVTGNGQQIVYPITDQAEVTAMTVELVSGAETGWHSHPVPVYAYVLTGSLDVELAGGQVITYRNGDAIIEVVDTLHNGSNHGTEPVHLAVFYTGVAGIPNVIKPAAAPPVPSPPTH